MLKRRKSSKYKDMWPLYGFVRVWVEWGGCGWFGGWDLNFITRVFCDDIWLRVWFLRFWSWRYFKDQGCFWSRQHFLKVKGRPHFLRSRWPFLRCGGGDFSIMTNVFQNLRRFFVMTTFKVKVTFAFSNNDALFKINLTLFEIKVSFSSLLNTFADPFICFLPTPFYFRGRTFKLFDQPLTFY